MDDLTGQIIGAAIEVHRELGVGLLESVYESALCYELALRCVALHINVRLKWMCAIKMW
ncbi:GxxExxY protein [Methylophilus sp. 3sh_L]|uniref:GxxExxY protein n=1 Tax=Methylophilus sp. 3sh_L TaxID=3377114 RepID=UPI00398EA332